MEPSLRLFLSLKLFVVRVMASIRVDGHEVPLVFSLDEHGCATVSTHLLHVRFKFVESSIYVEEEKHSESGEIQ